MARPLGFGTRRFRVLKALLINHLELRSVSTRIQTNINNTLFKTEDGEQLLKCEPVTQFMDKAGHWFCFEHSGLRFEVACRRTRSGGTVLTDREVKLESGEFVEIFNTPDEVSVKWSKGNETSEASFQRRNGLFTSSQGNQIRLHQPNIQEAIDLLVRFFMSLAPGSTSIRYGTFMPDKDNTQAQITDDPALLCCLAISTILLSA